jgi:hypothetical protein
MDEAATASASGGGGGAGMHSFQAEPEAALRAYNDGDWDLALSLADGFLDLSQSHVGPWESHLRGLRAWLRVLRGEPGAALLSGLQATIDQARASGFPQILRPLLALAGRCAALEGDAVRAAELYDELGTHFPGPEETPSREWLPAAVAVACFLDGTPATADARRTVDLQERLLAAGHQTRWVKAALASLRSAEGRREGDAKRALAAAEEAVALYGEIGDETERGLAVAHAASCERDVRGPGRWEWELAAFAARTGATRLLPAPSSASEVLGLIPDRRQAPAGQPD